MQRRRRNRGLAWAFGVSAALHVLAAVVLLAGPELPPSPPPPPDQDATVEVVMGNSAEANGAESPPPVPPAVPATAPAPKEAPPAAAPPPPPTAPEPAAEAPPPDPAPPTPDPPARPSWQATSLLGNGKVGAAEIVGDRLRRAEGDRGNLPPGYPPELSRLGEQGVVVLRMLIGADGLVQEVQVMQTSGYPRLDQAAQTAIARWRFTPAVENGQPVELVQDLPVHFRLN